MITVKIPNDWRDLQTKVAEILDNCGFRVEIEKKIKSIRGQVEIDVYAEEEVKGRTYTIVCECKHWKAAIPQNVIHGFRTVISDLGSNIGYIITTSGFQKRAVDTSKFTNIELLTWEEFQLKFLRNWFDEYFVKKITEELDPLMTYTEPLLPKWYYAMGFDDKKEFQKLHKKYWLLGNTVLVYFSSYSKTFKDDIPELPLRRFIESPEELEQQIPNDILDEAGYLELLEKIIEYGQKAIAEFRSLLDKYNKTDSDD